MLNNTFQSKSANNTRSVAKSTLKDAFIPASTIIWVTANTDSAAISHTLSEDKFTDPNLQNKPAKNFTMKTTVQADQSADIHMILENIHVFTTRSPNVDSLKLTADILMKKNWTSQSFVFLTLWEVAQTQTAKTRTTSITLTSIFHTMVLFESFDSKKHLLQENFSL